MAFDPVCKMEVNENAAMPSFVVDDKTYLFCSEGCRAEFQRRPHDYLKPAVSCCDEPSKAERPNV